MVYRCKLGILGTLVLAIAGCSGTEEAESGVLGTVSSALEGPSPACVFGTEWVSVANRASVDSDVMSNGWVEVQAGSTTKKTIVQGDIDAGAWARIGSNSIAGDVTAGQWIDVQLGAQVGTVTPYASVPPVTLPTRSVTPGWRDVFVQSPSNCNVYLSPGNYRSIYVNPGCTLTLNAGAYDVERLIVNADARLTVNGAVTLDANAEFGFGDRALLQGVSSPEQFQVYSNGSLRIGMTTTFRGMLSAPNGDATLSGSSTLEGCLKGRRVTLQPDAKLEGPTLDMCNPPLNSVVTAHGNTDWHIDTAHEFLFGVDMLGNPSAVNHTPDTWTRRHMHVDEERTSLFYYDTTLNPSGLDLDDEGGIDTQMLFFYAGHGGPTSWSTLGDNATQSQMKLGNCDNGGRLRYYWQCSCEVFAHGPPSCPDGGWVYSCPEEFDGSSDSAAMRNVYERWGNVLDDGYLRMACGSSTEAWCHESQTNQIWDNYNNLGFDVADSFIYGLHDFVDSPVVPVCLTTGGADVTQTPLYDTVFTEAPNLGGDYYHLQYLDSFAGSPVSGGTPLSYAFAELPVFQVVSSTGVGSGRNLSDFVDKGEYFESRALSADGQPELRIQKDSGAQYVRGQRNAARSLSSALSQSAYLRLSGTTVQSLGWQEADASAPAADRTVIIRQSKLGGSPDYFQKNARIVYRRQLAWRGLKLPVVGPGGAITVQLNSDGSILDASKIWRNAVAGRIVPVKPLATVLSEAWAQIDVPSDYRLSGWDWGYKEESGNVAQAELRVVVRVRFEASAAAGSDAAPRMVEIAAQ